MAFEFVENDKIDATSRKRIRSHVMKGKNAGKTRRRQTTQDDSVSSTCDSSSTEKSGSSSPDESTDRWVKILRPLGDELAYFSFPAPIDRFARNLITEFMYVQLQWIYPKEFCLSMDYIRGTWFSYIQMSETFLHASQLMATISLDGLRGKDLTSPKALHHLANTYRCFNRDLQLRRTPTDADMAVVVSLAVHGNLEASFGVSKVHLEALNRMLELRGGIEEFSTNWVLWHKFCRLVEIHILLALSMLTICVVPISIEHFMKAVTLYFIGRRCRNEQSLTRNPHYAMCRERPLHFLNNSQSTLLCET